MAYIYLHKNKINGKCYIGQTSQDPKKRWLNGAGYIECPKFYKAIQKYGWDNFEHIILRECSKEEVDDLERYYIELYDSINNGYNLDSGGNRNKIQSEETKKKISESHKGFKFTEKSKQKMSESHKGQKPWDTGKHLSDEHIIKLSESHRGIHPSDESRKKRSDSLKQAYSDGRKSRVRTQEQRDKISATLTGIKFLYKNDEQIRIDTKVEDINLYLLDGWTMGYLPNDKLQQRIERTRQTYKEHNWKGKLRRMTNGVINKTVYDEAVINQLLDEGYWFGMTKNKKENKNED